MNITMLGKSFELDGITGTVSGNKKWSETHVYGGSYEGSGGVSSTVNDRGEFWVISPGGRERVVHDCNLAVRDGQEVTVFWGNAPSEKTKWLFAIKNHANNSENVLDRLKAKKMLWKLNNPLIKDLFLIFVLPFIPGFFLSYLFDMTGGYGHPGGMMDHVEIALYLYMPAFFVCLVAFVVRQNLFIKLNRKAILQACNDALNNEEFREHLKR